MIEPGWYEFLDGLELPAWMRSFYVDEDETVFVPYFLGGFHTQIEAFLCAGYDGTRGVEIDGRAYFPVLWCRAMAEENGDADAIDLCDKILERAVTEGKAER